MSQVRGRIKTVVKYNDQLNTVGTCCGSDGTKTEKSFSQCSAEGGRWVPVLPIEDVECPNVSDRGCCCSCAYTTTRELQTIGLTQITEKIWFSENEDHLTD